MDIKYRIYPNGEILDEEDFEEYDNSLPYYDDFQVVEIPEEIVVYIIDCACGHTKKYT